MKKTEDIIWDYLDGNCTPEERSLVDRQLADDQSFRELFLQSQVLHKNLQKVETESPSMRFSQNVMDQLPAVRNLATVPLVSKKWLRIFGGTTVGLILFFLSGTLSVISTVSSPNQTPHWTLEFIASIFEYIPASTLIFTGIIAASLFSLLFLDKWLERRFR